jgi:hypothetical protein
LRVIHDLILSCKGAIMSELQPGQPGYVAPSSTVRADAEARAARDKKLAYPHVYTQAEYGAASMNAETLKVMADLAQKAKPAAEAAAAKEKAEADAAAKAKAAAVARQEAPYGTDAAAAKAKADADAAADKARADAAAAANKPAA